MLWGAAILMLCLLAGGFLWWRKRRGGKEAQKTARVFPHMAARKSIQELQKERLFERGQLKVFYFRFSEILRRYLEELRGFPAVEFTTQEIALAMKDAKDRELLALLRQADMVKFADFTPTQARKEEEVKKALGYIDDTCESFEKKMDRPLEKKDESGYIDPEEIPGREAVQMMFRFAYPLLLLLLLPVAGWLVFAWRKKTCGSNPFHDIANGRSCGGRGRVARRLPILTKACILILLAIAAARPQLYNVSRDIRSPGVDIVLCLDTSGSMQALDFTLDGTPVSRLTAVKKVVSDFIKKRETDRIGLVVFGEEAFTQAPLTVDKGLLLGLVDKMTIGMAGDRTAIGTAIAIGGKRLKDIEAKSKILILLTDGRQNSGSISPDEAAQAVRALGVKIYTIGVGGEGPAPFKVKTFFGEQTVYERVDLDEKTLKKVAETGGGRYFRASDSKELSQVYDIIDHAEKREVKVKEFFHFTELYLYFLIPAVFLLVLKIVLETLILRVLP